MFIYWIVWRKDWDADFEVTLFERWLEREKFLSGLKQAGIGPERWQTGYTKTFNAQAE
jgi:hypothetical protein